MVSRSMKTTPAVTCLKTLLALFTIVLWLIGAFLLGGGIYSKIKLGGYDLLTTYNYSSAPWVLIGIGIFILVIGTFGCCAIRHGNTCMLRTFAFALGIMFLAEIVLAIIVAVYRGKISSSFNEGMIHAMSIYKTNNDYKQAVDNAQSTLHCCGSHNYSDYWLKAQWGPYHVPTSCCSNTTACKAYETDGILALPHNETIIAEFIYTEGCPSKVFAMVNDNFAAILGSLCGVAGFQLIGVIISCCLASTINANKYELV